jgi:acetyltransferase-like isoleucine patch superfamily enzyme
MVRRIIKHIKILFYKRKKIYLSRSIFLGNNVIIENNNNGSINIGSDTEILHGVIIMTYGGKIEIGEKCSINPYTIIYGHGGLKIGNNVLIAGHTMIIPSNHNFSNLLIPINKQGETKKGIIIEDDVWIGSGCKILDGVKIHSGAIIAAGSVVNRDVPSNSIYGGIPANFIKSR